MIEDLNKIETGFQTDKVEVYKRGKEKKIIDAAASVIGKSIGILAIANLVGYYMNCYSKGTERLLYIILTIGAAIPVALQLFCELHYHTVKVTGEVTSFEKKVTHGGGDEGSTVTYPSNVRFNFNGGEFNVTVSFYLPPKIGKKTALRVDPYDPTDTFDSMKLLTLLFVLLISVGGMAIFSYLVYTMIP